MENSKISQKQFEKKVRAAYPGLDLQFGEELGYGGMQYHTSFDMGSDHFMITMNALNCSIYEVKNGHFNQRRKDIEALGKRAKKS
jgi:hypothetical protein